MSDWEIIEGDCIKAMQAMPEASVDAIVTDPPYGLGFMGKAWDSLPPGHEVGKAFLHVLKPGGHVVAFGGTRTYHRLACALEDAGFEIRDSLIWVYGSGFPKSLDVSKAIDRAAGEERRIVGRKGGRYDHGFTPESAAPLGQNAPRPNAAVNMERAANITAPATDAARDWQGWGTALKPSHEPIVLARKPLVGTVAANVEQHGTGAINIDSCRVPGVKPVMERTETVVAAKSMSGESTGATGTGEMTTTGRWPPNLLLTHAADCTEEDCGETCPVAEMDRQSGEAGQAAALTGNEPRLDGMSGSVYGSGKGSRSFPLRGDSGGASRFFPRFRYVAKASSGERNAGLEGMAEGHPVGGRDKWTEQDRRRGEGVTRTAAANVHPTVKPVALMRWLCRLITPPGGTVLDPFAGSGTTLLAAIQEGFRAIGIEREPEYAAIARRRVEEDAPLFNRGTA